MRCTLHSYQRAGKEYIIRHMHCGLFWEMGLGKTLATLTAVEELIYDRFEIRKVLIIAPLRVAQDTWQAEGRRWDHLRYLRFATVLGAESMRLAALRQEADCYVINRENVAWLCRQYRGKQFPFDMLIVDESSSFKNPRAKRFRDLRKVRAVFKRIVILTGTPAPNNLHDLWAQIYLLDAGERLGRTLGEFRRRYFQPGMSNGYTVYEWFIRGEKERKQIYDGISDICMSLKTKDYLQLPGRIDNVVRIAMDPGTEKIYKKMEKEMAMELEGEEITAQNAAALSNKLLQMANGAIYDDNKGVIELHNLKIQKLKEIMEDNDGKPVLVFYSFIHDKDRIKASFPQAAELKDAGSIRQWNKGRIPLLLAHPASCGYGLNLQAGGSIIVWFGLTWSLEQYQQANARLYRQGQDKPVIIHHLVMDGTIDGHVMAALQAKKTGQDALMEAIKAHLRGE